MDYAGRPMEDAIDRPLTLLKTHSPEVHSALSLEG